MFPRTYYETFMRYEAQNQVFVAMPFSKPFQVAFDKIIEPAIRLVTVNDRSLEPRIINRAISGSPDIHEQIYDAILHSRLVIADLTVQASSLGENGTLHWQANANVAYEVGLAAAWRNPEDILLIHQGHPDHQYSFDVQNLRHVQYRLDQSSVAELANEFVRALNQSAFLARQSFQKLVESVSPSTLQFMHQETRRAFPVISFQGTNMPLLDARIHAATELLTIGALKNRNVLSQGESKGVAVVYEWTELGLRLLIALHAASIDRVSEMRTQIRSVMPQVFPPDHLRRFPEDTPLQTEGVGVAELPDDSK